MVTSASRSSGRHREGDAGLRAGGASAQGILAGRRIKADPGRCLREANQWRAVEGGVPPVCGLLGRGG
jgi:hypothetical protein